MDRNREARRSSIVGTNGFKRRRQRTNSLRASPDDDLELELQESVRLRDRVKKDRDRERERERDQERLNRSKRRRAERLMNNREDIGRDESSDQDSVNDDEDEQYDEIPTTVSGGGVRLVPLVLGSVSNHHSGHLINHQHSHHSSLGQPQHNCSSNNIISSNHHLQHRKTFPSSSSSSSKIFKAAPVWKPGDEMIGVSVPRKARSACTKRSHNELISSSSNNNSASGVTGDQIHHQASTSPANQGPNLTSAPSPVALVSPSSSNISIRKNLKLHSVSSNGPKVKLPKGSSRTSSSNPEELEIEIAEVLYGLKTQSQGPSLNKEENRSSNDAKSLVSSPNSNPTSANNLVVLPNLTPLSAVAPKRKRPRQVLENPSYGARSNPILEKAGVVQASKNEVPSPKLEKVSGTPTENGGELGVDSVHLEGPHEHLLELKTPAFVMAKDSQFASAVGEVKNGVDLVEDEDTISAMVKESSVLKTEDSSRVELTLTATALAAVTVIKATSSAATELENQMEKKFFIDLMVPPPHVKSPERETKSVVDQKPAPSIMADELKSLALKDREIKKAKNGIDHDAEEKEIKTLSEEDEAQKPFGNKVKNIDLHLDMKKSERGISGGDAAGNKLFQQAQKQQHMPLKVSKKDPLSGKSGPVTSSLPLPLPIVNWHGRLPSMGYMTPLQGIVSMDSSTVPTMPIQPQLSQPRPKRCATHCYLARNISYIQQFMKMNPFWTAAAGTASLFGSNINTMPVTDLHGNIAFRGVDNAQDKGQHPTGVTSHSGNGKTSQPSCSDTIQRKPQILLHQSLPPNNLMGPAFIFPLNQQQATVAVSSSRSGPTKSHSSAGQASLSSASSPAVSGSTTAGAATTAVSFNYPNMGSNEKQYLTILQNNAYPFPIPAVGAPPNFGGSPAQAIPMFSGTFYPSQMIHPSQLQHHQPIVQQSTQSQQAHYNATTSSVSSSSQKHPHNLQQKPQSSGVSVVPGSSTSQNLPAQKSHSSQQLQQSVNQQVQSVRPQNLENEAGCDESLSADDNRGSWASINVYGQNFAMPIHPQNFSLMTPPSALTTGTGNQSERQQQQQHQGSKTGVRSIPPHSFAMSFGPMNGSTPGPGIDLSMAQNYPMFHSFPDSTRQNIQMMAAASSASQATHKKSYRIYEDIKSGVGDTSTVDEERRNISGKGQGGVGQAIAFRRSDVAGTSSTSIQTSNVIDGPFQSLNVSSGPARSSRSVITTKDVVPMNIQNAHFQAQPKQPQMLQMMQRAAASASNRSKTPSCSSNANIYSEQLNASSLSTKFPSALSVLVPNNVQGNNGSASQSHQWKNSSITPTSQSPSPMASATGSTFKSLSQQHSHIHPQMHTQISFGGSQKTPLISQGQVPPSGNLAPSPVVVGSPSTSSISKGSSGSPRTTSASNNKIVQTSSLSSQPPKHSPSVPSQKSPTMLGNPPHVPTPSGGAKPHIHQSHQQLPVNVQQTQLFFSNPYSQVQSPQSTSMSPNSSGPGGFYMQRRRSDQNVQPSQQQAGATSTSSTGVLPPVSLSSARTNDPAKAIATATFNAKGGGMASVQLSAESSGTLSPAGFSHVHPIPAVLMKSPEQKQTAGNDNLQPWQPEKK